MICNRIILKNEYDNIWNTSKNKILKNDINVDHNLSDLQNDKRLGISLIIPVGKALAGIFYDGLRNVKLYEPDQYYYPPSDMHITLLDLIAANENFVFCEKQVAAYKEVLCEVFKLLKSFKIQFNGLTASAVAVMVRGFPSIDIFEMRQHIRRALFPKKSVL